MEGCDFLSQWKWVLGGKGVADLCLSEVLSMAMSCVVWCEGCDVCFTAGAKVQYYLRTACRTVLHEVW